MRRIQLYLEEDLDDRLGVEAARSGRSRSELVREAVRQWLDERTGPSSGDALDAVVGWLDIGPADDLDAVIYDR